MTCIVLYINLDWRMFDNTYALVMFRVVLVMHLRYWTLRALSPRGRGKKATPNRRPDKQQQLLGI